MRNKGILAAVVLATVTMQTVVACGAVLKNKLDDGFYASPAVVEGALILRTTKHLYRVEQ